MADGKREGRGLRYRDQAILSDVKDNQSLDDCVSVFVDLPGVIVA